MRVRKIHFAAAAVLAAFCALAAMAAANSWQIDPAHSAAQFAVRHMGISTVRGEFHNLQGAVLLDESDITRSSVSVTMDTASVDTREPARDKHLRSPDFFDAEKYPLITFQSTRVEQPSPGQLKITGDLTIRGVTKSVVLDATVPPTPIKDARGNLRTAASATTKINRQDFGVKWNGKLPSGEWVVSDEVSITLDIEMTRKPGPEQAK